VTIFNLSSCSFLLPEKSTCYVFKFCWHSHFLPAQVKRQEHPIHGMIYALQDLSFCLQLLRLNETAIADIWSDDNQVIESGASIETSSPNLNTTTQTSLSSNFQPTDSFMTETALTTMLSTDTQAGDLKKTYIITVGGNPSTYVVARPTSSPLSYPNFTNIASTGITLGSSPKPSVVPQTGAGERLSTYKIASIFSFVVASSSLLSGFICI
jgi:hypothetical protein